MKLKIEFQNTLGQPTTAEMARQLIVRVDDAELIELFRALRSLGDQDDELRRDQFDETTKALMARAKVDGAKTVTQFADRFAGKLDAMSIAIAATALEGSWNASRSTAFRDAARLLREEVGL